MSYKLFITPKAQHQIKDLHQDTQARIGRVITALREDPRPPGAKKLKQVEGLYRVRSSDYRIVYAIEDDLLVLLVVTIGRRRDVYRKLAQKYNPDYLRSIIEDND